MGQDHPPPATSRQPHHPPNLALNAHAHFRSAVAAAADNGRHAPSIHPHKTHGRCASASATLTAFREEIKSGHVDVIKIDSADEHLQRIRLVVVFFRCVFCWFVALLRRTAEVWFFFTVGRSVCLVEGPFADGRRSLSCVRACVNDLAAVAANLSYLF